MKYYGSIEEIVKKCTQSYQMLIKFGTRENLIKLQAGSLYMKNLKYYNELEAKDGDGKPDEYDGKWAVQDVKVILSDPRTMQPIALGTAKKTVMSFGYEMNPVFCLFSYDYRNCGEPTINQSTKNIQIATKFNDEQIAKLKTGLGEYALIILDTDAFLQRVDKTLKDQRIEYLCKRVIYNYGNSVDRVDSILADNKNIAFNKDKDTFSYQQELRILVLNQRVDDHICLDIGDIKSITKLISTDELLQLRIELNQQFEIVEE